MAEVGVAYVTLLPSAKGFAANASRSLTPGMAGLGRGMGLKLGGALGVAAIGAAAIGFAKKAVSLEAAFSQTMNTLGAVADVPAKELDKLSDLAIKMGEDTIFSAGEAAEAMLELGKNGITPAVIQAGALDSALQLAAAGGVGMAEAATIMGNSLNAFGLKGKDSAEVADALAGAANASSADIGSLAQGLSLASTVAADAGLSIQETTGALAAFANAGVAGSDAGTSLKTFLSRLIPATDKARVAMQQYELMTYDANTAAKVLAEDGIKSQGSSLADTQVAVAKYLVSQGVAKEGTVGLTKATDDYINVSGIMRSDFVKSNGDFKSLGAIAGELDSSFSKLSQSERGAALQTIFGADARRAATILTKQGAEGLAKYVKKTSEAGGAQKVADARMKGTAGALERLSGSVETVTLQFGKFLSPATVVVLDTLDKAVGNIVPGFEKMSASISGGGGFDQLGSALGVSGDALSKFGADVLPTLTAMGTKIAGTVGPALTSIGFLISTQLLPAFNKILPNVVPVAKFLIAVIGGAIIGAFKGAVQVIKGVVNVISGVFKLVAALVRGDWQGAWDAVKQVVFGVIDIVIGAIKVWLNVGILAIFKQGFKILLKSWSGLWKGIKSIGGKAISGVQSLIGKGLSLLGRLFMGALKFIVKLFFGWVKFVFRIWKGLFVGIGRLVVTGWKVLRSAFGGAIAAIRTIIVEGIKRFIGFWKGLLTSLKNAAVNGFARVVGFFKAFPGRIVKGLGNLKDLLVQKGKDLVSGIWTGISKMGTWLKDKVMSFVTEYIPGPIAKALGMESPSRVMAKQAENIPLGMVVGIESQAGKVDDAMTKLTRGATITRPRMESVALTADGRGTGGGALFGDVHVQPHDYSEFAREMQTRARVASGGGVNIS